MISSFLELIYMYIFAVKTKMFVFSPTLYLDSIKCI